MLDFSKNHFELFGLQPRFGIDADTLDRAYRDLQTEIHPDRFAHAGEAEQRLAVQWATRANEAYRTLADPGGRAAYLCQAHGVALNAESNTAMPREFLLQQMEWRDALDEARAAGDRGALCSLRRELNAARAALLAEIGAAIDRDRDYRRAADAVRRWMFVDRFGAEVSSAGDGVA
jgi:molecular chaperone HscB